MVISIRSCMAKRVHLFAFLRTQTTSLYHLIRQAYFEAVHFSKVFSCSAVLCGTDLSVPKQEQVQQHPGHGGGTQQHTCAHKVMPSCYILSSSLSSALHICGLTRNLTVQLDKRMTQRDT